MTVSNLSRSSIVLIACSLALASAAAFAVEWKGHPHLKRAHEAIENAAKALQAAKDEKRGEFGGHRDKAEQLLREAQHEIEEAVEYANHAPKK